jgi:hypothetical protein
MIRLRTHFKSDRPTPKYYVANPQFQPKQLAPDIELKLDAIMSDFINSVHPQVRRNMSADVSKALSDLIKDPNIIVKPSDKNLGLVLMSKDWYVSECLLQLADSTTYSEITNVPFEDLLRELRETIGFYLPDDFSGKKFLLSHGGSLPRFYIIPKIHKDPVVGRPIIASPGYLFHNASIYVADELLRIAQQYKSVLKDSLSLIPLVENFPLPADVILFTGDITSLYTNISVPHFLEIIEPILPQFCDYPDAIFSFLNMILRNNYFEFNSKYYLQISGIAMGTPAAVSIANIFMAEFEKDLIKSPHLLFYRRFIDDVFWCLEWFSLSTQRLVRQLQFY